MTQSEVLEKARQFARTRYLGEFENIARDRELKMVQMQSQLAARGIVMSGTMVFESAKIDAEQIRAMTELRLDAILEGYELHGVSIDDQTAVNICDEVTQAMNQLIHSSKFPSVWANGPSELKSQYSQMVAKACGLSANSIKTVIDRRRLLKKKSEGQTIIYNVQGDNARWNTNSTDNSVNIVTKTNAEFFATLREKIASAVPEGDERKAILQKLDSLQEAQGKSSFLEKYKDFIATAANHMALLGPFIPALTEMLHKGIG